MLFVRYYLSTWTGLIISIVGLVLAFAGLIGLGGGKNRKNKDNFVLLLIFSLLIGLLVVNYCIMEDYTKVPDVTTLLIDNAKARLESAEMGLTTVEGEQPEIVLEQESKAGSIVKKNTAVTLICGRREGSTDEIAVPTTENAVSTEATTPTAPAVTEVSMPMIFGQQAEEGNVISLGTYYRAENTKAPIEWSVLDVEENNALLLSRMAIDCLPYNDTKEDVTWETCTLRGWLNNTFYWSAFSEDERNRIQETYIEASVNPQYSTYVGNDTLDKVFLLSISEVASFLPSDEDRICRETEYAKAMGGYRNSNTGGSWWWLRTSGSSSQDAASVNSDGSIDYDDGTITSSKGTVRPAIVVSLDNSN